MAAMRGQLGAVVLEGARVLVEILVLPELKSVHEDGGDHERRVLLSDFHQPQMALVDVAHGRHTGHCRLTLEPLPQLSYASDDFHDGD